MAVGMITDIERCSFRDGPGIRTVVFFKGCNMHCKWCHNPETISPRKSMMYYPQRCISCFKCVYACPSKAQKRIDGVHRFFPRLCIQCGKCAAVCYAEAMVASSRSMKVEDVMREVRQDKAYYQGSGGGVTLTGGEVMCQIPFAVELADACRAEGIPVGIETNLCLPFEQMLPLLSRSDVVMCDLKLWDSSEHQRWTGVPNELIIENIRRLDELGKPIIVRTPLIPGATDSEENISAISAFLVGIKNLSYYELLNFNPLGGSKYESMGLKNEFAGAKPLPRERVAALAAVARAHCTTRTD